MYSGLGRTVIYDWKCSMIPQREIIHTVYTICLGSPHTPCGVLCASALTWNCYWMNLNFKCWTFLKVACACLSCYLCACVRLAVFCQASYLCSYYVCWTPVCLEASQWDHDLIYWWYMTDDSNHQSIIPNVMSMMAVLSVLLKMIKWWFPLLPS